MMSFEDQKFLIKSYGFGLYLFEPINEKKSIKISDISDFISHLGKVIDVIETNSGYLVITEDGHVPVDVQLSYVKEDISIIETASTKNDTLKNRLQLFKTKL